jgi:hypothetical protein
LTSTLWRWLLNAQVWLLPRAAARGRSMPLFAERVCQPQEVFDDALPSI